MFSGDREIVPWEQIGWSAILEFFVKIWMHVRSNSKTNIINQLSPESVYFCLSTAKFPLRKNEKLF